MVHFDNLVMLHIKEIYESLTNVEKSIADFFITNRKLMDFSSKYIASMLYVSEASLSRFAQKCGYKGFREFIYDYQRELKGEKKKQDINELTKSVLNQYQILLDQSLALVNEEQMYRIATMLSEHKRIFAYGKGSSGEAAKEFSMRFMRLGLYIEAITDSHIIKMNSALVDKDVLIIGVSLSADTKEIVTGLQIAKKNGAKILLITANQSTELKKICDEILYVAGFKDLQIGTHISPQFPILVMVDIFYSYFFHHDFYIKSAKHTDTISALYGDLIEEKETGV